ncbi:small mechanosensitive channel protein, MscS family [Psychroflexus torquis ATCC 700755]|uniref:Small mechanosensitive channel protein, MscS family n=1 Tax=Psychroflexus torquis (strain ATCC 700755 / CIP 106069 / ACAM 623) TaxID=313595 RepID=K4IW53_PSYTT|nr:mechanosensitive ion channel domain-containing protein [Psychroflexus torquis]AFU69690.1 small mechanosensitive channel protein, MscS family [Psychroflexus torquis ATCC 700755]
MEDIEKILEFEIISIGQYNLKIISLFVIFLIIVVTKIVLWLIKRSIFRKKKLAKFNEGNSYASFQLIKYVIWVIAAGFILETFGVKVTILIAGSAALLVGIGLGLQQTFNDIISGIILLSERSIKIEDILEIDGDVVKIQEIGLRSSKGLNTDDISIIIPNSLITTNKVINWSHQTKKTRFRIDVGVSYASDVDLVLKILKESALEHSDIFEKDLVEVRLVNFGNSSLDFQILFFSKNIFRINKVKSDIRRIITKKFIQNKVTIPFPQMDVYIKSNPKGD